MTPTVSVLMPVFNGEQYLQKALDSVAAQSLKDFELIVVDDGSRDATPHILATFPDSRLRVVEQANSGIASALNAGLARARGRYVARMDADDVALPTRLQRQVEFLDARPDIAVVGCSYQRIDAEGKPFGLTATLCTPESLARMLYVHNPLAHGSVIARTEVLQQAGGYSSTRVPAEDYDLWVRLTAGGHRLAALPEVLYQYRVHGSTTRLPEQVRAFADLRDWLWSQGQVSSPSLAEVRREVKAFRRVPAPLGTALVSEYDARHYSLIREAVTRRRWDVLRRLAAVAPLFLARHRLRRDGR